MPKRLVIIPVYNEEDNIKPLLNELRSCYKGELLFVNDGSSDSSMVVLEGLTQDKIAVLNHPKNLGYGTSLIDGFKYAEEAGFEEVVTMDCDFQHHPGYIAGFFENLAWYDVVSGSRYLIESESDQAAPPDRRSINEKITGILNKFLPWKLTDSFCGFKGYRISALRKLKLTEPGYAFPMQFWVQAARFGLTVGELAVPRLYPDSKKVFGGVLSDPDKRYNFYLSVIERERDIWSV